MSDHILFAVVPYFAVVAFILGSAFSAASGPIASSARRQGAARRRRVVAACAIALAAGHVALLVAPDAVLRWNRSMARLLFAEGVGICLGTLCLLAVAQSLWRRITGSSARSLSAGDVIASTLVAMEIGTGLALAVLYRWASSWSVVTLTPYALSVLKRLPRVELVAATPLVVRLHIFCTFAILVALPFTTVGSLALVTARRVAVGALAPAYESARTVIAARIGRVVRAPGSLPEEGS